ncbi:hypothetical protein CR513_61899, partial [Mucuna pruriens]
MSLRGPRLTCLRLTHTSYATVYPSTQVLNRLPKKRGGWEKRNERELHYPTWLANVVMVRKLNGKWWMCTDYTDLNKACPKDPYPLPKHRPTSRWRLRLWIVEFHGCLL